MKSILFQLVIAVLVPTLVLVVVDAYAKQSIPLLNYSPHDRTEGRDIFLRRCARCHNNLEQNPFVKIGPNLHDLGTRARLVNGEQMPAAEYVLQSIISPDAYRVIGYGMMPKNLTSDLTEQQMRNLVSYLVGPIHDKQVAALQIPTQTAPAKPLLLSRKEAELAESVFRSKGQCIACHSIYQTPEYNALAPNLLQSGYRDLSQLEQAIRKPSATVAEQYRLVSVQLAEGKIVTGKRLHSTNLDVLRLLTTDARGNAAVLRVPMSQIEEENGEPTIYSTGVSPMPEGLDKQLTDEEIRAVCRLIIALNE